MKRVVKASTDTDIQTVLDLAKEGRSWGDMAFLKGSGKDVWYTIVKTKGVMPDGTPARLMVSEYIGNYDTGLYFERDFFTNVNGLLSKLRTPVVVERESEGNIFLEGHIPYGKRGSYWDKNTPSTVESSSWLAQAFSDRGFPEGWQVREDYYSGKYDNVSEGVSDDDTLANVVTDLVGTRMYLMGKERSATFYLPTSMKGTSSMMVAKFTLDDDNHLVFEDEYRTSAYALVTRNLEDPLIIRSKSEIERGDY